MEETINRLKNEIAEKVSLPDRIRQFELNKAKTEVQITQLQEKCNNVER